MNRLSDLVAFMTAGVSQAVLPNVTPLEQLKNDLFGKSFRLDEKLNMREASLSKSEQDIGNNFFLAKLSCPTPPTLAGIEKLEAKFDKAYQLATNGDLSELVKSPTHFSQSVFGVCCGVSPCAAKGRSVRPDKARRGNGGLGITPRVYA